MERHELYLEMIRSEPEPERWDERTRRHVAECSACRKQAVAAGVLRARLAALPSARTPMPHELRARLRAQLNEAVEPVHTGEHPAASKSMASSPWRRLGAPLALVAGIVLGLGLARMGVELPGARRPETPATVAGFLADVTHDLYLLNRTGRPLERSGADAVELSRWLSDGLGFAVTIPRAPHGWSLQGGRLWHTLSRIAALASYESLEGERFVVFAVPAANMDFSDVAPEPHGGQIYYRGKGWGHAGVVWRDGELAWGAAGDLDPDALLDRVLELRGVR